MNIPITLFTHRKATTKSDVLGKFLSKKMQNLTLELIIINFVWLKIFFQSSVFQNFEIFSIVEARTFMHKKCGRT